MSTSKLSAKPLAGIGQQIHSHFVDLGKLAGQSDSVEKAISNEQQRFQLWARNLGLYHRGHSSLDYRLRDSILLFDYTLGLLRDLENAISELQRKLRETWTPFDEPENISDQAHRQKTRDESSDSDSGEDLSAYPAGIDSYTRRRIASLVLNQVLYRSEKTSTPFDAPKNISNQAHCQEHSDESSESDSDENLSSYEAGPTPILLVNTITSIIDRLYRLAFKIRNPRIRIGLTGTLTTAHKQLNAESHLITCLRASDAARIQDLLRSYNPTHEDKKTDFLIQRLVNANAHRRRQFEYWRHRREQYEAQSNFELTGVAASISQPATASVLDPKKIDIHETTSISSTGTSLRSAFEGSDPYSAVPNPPPLEAGAKEFECPYCYTLLSSTTHRKDKWELHIYRDLRPYICTVQDCKDPDQQYDSFHDWVSHETSTHMSQSVSKYIRLSSRPDVPSGTQQTNSLVRKCPFCEDEAASAAHIASHLRRIACFALPSSESDKFEDETSLPASEEAMVDSDSSEESLPRVADEANSPSRLSVSTHQENFDRGGSSQQPGQVDSKFEESKQFFPGPIYMPPPAPGLKGLSALEQVAALAGYLHQEIVPLCKEFVANPPTDSKFRELQHRKLSETILAQVLLKVDSIEPDGDPTIRNARKALIKEAQLNLDRVDQVEK